MNATLYKCLFSDIHHISYIVNNVVILRLYGTIFRTSLFCINTFLSSCSISVFSVFLVDAFCYCRYLLACYCLAVIQLKFKL